MKVEESLNVTFDESPSPPKTSPLEDDDLVKEEAIKVSEKKPLGNDVEDDILENDKIVNIKESKSHPLENVIENLNQRTLRSQAQDKIIMEYFVKISKKARILDLKRRNLKETVLTFYTPYPSRNIWRICAYTLQETMKNKDLYAVSRRHLYIKQTSLAISTTKAEYIMLMPRVVKSRDEIFSRWGYCDNHDLSRLDNQSIERDRLIGIGFVLNFVKFISFTFGDKEMISVIEAVSR
ncbi:hypothetical protein Tco_0319285 [Tanacetum coccineum]